MHRYFFTEHTTDICMQLEATTLEELFIAALEGMSSVIKHDALQQKGVDVSKKVTVTSEDLTALLVDFLSAVLTQSHILQVVFTQLVNFDGGEHQVTATVLGYRVRAFDEDIKAVTYHGAYAEQFADGVLRAQVIFDI